MNIHVTTSTLECGSLAHIASVYVVFFIQIWNREKRPCSTIIENAGQKSKQPCLYHWAFAQVTHLILPVSSGGPSLLVKTTAITDEKRFGYPQVKFVMSYQTKLLNSTLLTRITQVSKISSMSLIQLQECGKLFHSIMPSWVDMLGAK